MPTLQELLDQQAVKPARKRHNDEEHRIQCSCVRWFNLKYRKLQGRLFAVPNGGKRDARTAAILKEEGVVAGVADLILLIPNRFYGALLIEMKTAKGKQSTSQKQWQKLITERREYKYIVCRSLDEFISEVEDYIKYCD
jgi:hypothetical protein